MQLAQAKITKSLQVCTGNALFEDPQTEMAAEDLGTAYQGQDDIQDKLLLDLAWERQQKKVKVWVSRHMRLASGALGVLGRAACLVV